MEDKKKGSAAVRRSRSSSRSDEESISDRDDDDDNDDDSIETVVDKVDSRGNEVRSTLVVVQQAAAAAAATGNASASSSAPQPEQAPVAAAAAAGTAAGAAVVGSLRLSTVDVVCGRGFQPDSFEGNLRMHGLTDAYRASYNSSSKKQKAHWVQRVIKDIKQSGGRFVQIRTGPNSSIPEGAATSAEASLDTKLPGERREKDFLVGLVDEATAYNKVSHAFRSKGRSRMCGHKRPNSSSPSAIGSFKYDLLSNIAPNHAGVQDGRNLSATSHPTPQSLSSPMALLSQMAMPQAQSPPNPQANLLASLLQSNPAMLSLLSSSSGLPVQQGAAVFPQLQQIPPQQLRHQEAAIPLPNNPLANAIASLATSISQQQIQQQQQFQQQLQLQSQQQQFQQQSVNPLLMSMLVPGMQGTAAIPNNPVLQQNLQQLTALMLLQLPQQLPQGQQHLGHSISSMLSAPPVAAPGVATSQTQTAMTLAMNQNLSNLFQALANPNINLGGGIGSNGANVTNSSRDSQEREDGNNSNHTNREDI